MLKIKLLYFTLSIITFLSSCPQRIKVGIFSKQKVETALIEVVKGKYTIYANGMPIYKLDSASFIYVSIDDSMVKARTLNLNFGKFRQIEICKNKQDTSNTIRTFEIKPIVPDVKKRKYDDDLIITSKKGSLSIVNQIDINRYIAAVVESEGGGSSPFEYAKSQAVICRTYAFRNWNKHAEDGFQLCDDVHCQSYLHSCTDHSHIRDAANQTNNLVIVDTAFNFINAVFHANCGGMTGGAEDVWNTPLSYLQPIKDEFCLKERQTNWTKTIPFTQWRDYLLKNGFHINNLKSNAFAFYQPIRKKYYKLNRDSIDLNKVRNDLNLKSTYFSIIPQGKNLILKGHGYGHGVGMCQEGAMRMALTGHTFEEIIHYYYRNVQIIELSKQKNKKWQIQ